MKRFLLVSLAVVTFGSLVWAGTAIYKQYMRAMEFDFSPMTYRIVTVSRRRIAFEVDLQITNKSDLDVVIMDYDFDVYINGSFATKIHQPPLLDNTGRPVIDPITHQPKKKEQRIAPMGDSIVTLVVDFDPNNVFKSVNKFEVITGIITDPSTIVVRFAGSFDIRVSGVKIEKIPYDDQFTLADMGVNPLIGQGS